MQKSIFSLPFWGRYGYFLYPYKLVIGQCKKTADPQMAHLVLPTHSPTLKNQKSHFLPTHRQTIGQKKVT